MISSTLQQEIEKEIKRKILSIAPLSAANNAQIYRLSLDGGSICVAKVAERGLDTEAFMLKYLKEKTKLPVPGIYYSNEHVIIMEFIDSQYSKDDQSERHAAELLGELHKVTAPMFGFERETLIGAMKQPNTQTQDWCAFFTQHRLLYMAQETLKESKIDAKIMKMVEKLAGKLPQYIKNIHPPGLVHGDIWGGNILFGRSRVLAFLDPAIYYADPEVELAFLKLFNTFNGSFFSRYNEINPIKPGFDERADIYNLYPLLVHTRLFGPSYARKAQRILEKFV